jgi:hypothetical protein
MKIFVKCSMTQHEIGLLIQVTAWAGLIVKITTTYADVTNPGPGLFILMLIFHNFFSISFTITKITAYKLIMKTFFSACLIRYQASNDTHL